ncbi:MAG: amino acid ABC transporter substrate-binding protein [Pseudomonadales bacterium]|uniref:Amino acid ABC transporter periplasmic protein n=1 Tax=Oleiphilus messinensis TaxID=141451 RepID=A0A1Y0I1Z0_9GAMM|nr:amino acid ABC transporter substrate-binding protein [Oleiphilus messinensis]ARU54270.1 amino acid ABC transporter periplasmic protein [Oleiphilus messinensis]MCG8611169.1 amino acid ABC transporter substrate-binding protein [Pseudomonadales bacterium]
MAKLKHLAAGAAVLLAATTSVQAGTTFDAVKKKGFLQCGVSTGLPGFSNQDDKGNWKGIDVDVCRAVAAAMFGDASKVKYTPLNAKERFTALQSGEVDLLSRNTTWTLTRDTSLGINFAGVNYYDGQGFMVKKSLGVKSAKELDGATICIQAGTTTELNLADYFRAQGMKFNPLSLDTSDATAKAFDAGRCDVLTSDQSQLYALRIQLSKPESAVVLPEVISKEPLGPAVRQGDDEWFNLVKWSLFTMLEAEDLGISSKNVDQLKRSSKNPSHMRVLGVTPGMGEKLGVPDDFGYNIVKQVGNYAEIFDKNVGEGSPLKISRGLNALWKDGGIQYAPPVR